MPVILTTLALIDCPRQRGRETCFINETIRVSVVLSALIASLSLSIYLLLSTTSHHATTFSTSSCPPRFCRCLPSREWFAAVMPLWREIGVTVHCSGETKYVSSPDAIEPHVVHVTRHGSPPGTPLLRFPTFTSCRLTIP